MSSTVKPLGSLEAIVGCMFSGKSDVLVERYLQLEMQFGKGRALAIRHFMDTRDSLGSIVSRSGRKVPARTVRDANDILIEVQRAPGVRGVLIDEAQFFEPDLVPLVDLLAMSGLRVFCAGVDTDCSGQPFGHMPALLAVADKVTKRYAWCVQCPRDSRQRARRNQWIGAGSAPLPGEKRPGGEKMYEPRCRNCFVPPAP